MNERMDSSAKTSTAEEQRVQDVLNALGSAHPEDGFEQRLARRLAEVPVQQQKPVWKWAKLRLPLALAAGCVAVLVSVALLQPRYREHGLVDVPKGAKAVQGVETVAERRPATRAAQPVHWNADPALKPRLQRFTAALRPRAESKRTEAALREASFPAPPMPLTEQEQLLLRLAHRDDPEEIAMLNPVERGLQAAREREQSAKFFAPAPLPPEIQEQINDALRSQYVNTPPPQELLAQTTNRSTP